MIIYRYLSKEIVSTLFVVTTVLMVAFLSQQVVRYLNYVAIGKVSNHVLLQLIGFEVPFLFSLLLPLGLYLSILLALGRLSADNEMTVLRMSGFSSKNLLQLITGIALIVSLIVFILMLWVNPWISLKRQQIMTNDDVAMHLVQTLAPGRFQGSPDGRYVMYVEKMSRDHQRAENVFLAEEKKIQKEQEHAWMLVFAELGYQMKDKDSGEQFFVTTDGHRYEGTPGQNNYKIIQFKKYAVRLPTNDTHTVHQEDESLSTLELWQDYKNPKKAAELQWRFSMALSALLLAFLAVSFSGMRRRQAKYFILLPAVFIYIVYINLLFIARHWLDQGEVPVWMGMWWPHVLFLFLILCILFFKNKRGSRHD